MSKPNLDELLYITHLLRRSNTTYKHKAFLYSCQHGRIQKYGLGGVKGWGIIPSPPLGFPLPVPFFLLPLPLPFSAPPLPLEVGSLIQLGSLGSAVSSPSGVWGGAPSEIEFGTF